MWGVRPSLTYKNWCQFYTADRVLSTSCVNTQGLLPSSSSAFGQRPGIKASPLSFGQMVALIIAQAGMHIYLLIAGLADD